MFSVVGDTNSSSPLDDLMDGAEGLTLLSMENEMTSQVTRVTERPNIQVDLLGPNDRSEAEVSQSSTASVYKFVQ